MKKKLLVICGPTATGKTKLGLFLAKKMGGEIVSADSRQIYRGMDVGTGKDLPVNSKFKASNSKLKSKSKNLKIGYYLIEQIPIWLYDLAEPNYRFNVAEYVECAKLVIANIWQKEKLPILVGGTGFYIRALIEGIETLGVLPDWELRWRLRDSPAQRLFNLFCRLDPDKAALMNASDRQNPRRIIRALEIAQKKSVSKSPRLLIDDFLMIGLKAPNKVLYQRIDRRVEERVKQGIEKEIKRLLKRGYHWQNSALGQTLGYQEWEPYFKEKKENEGALKSIKKEVVQRWKYNEHGFARRQLTWFRKNRQIRWFDITNKDWEKKAEKLAENWLSA